MLPVENYYKMINSGLNEVWNIINKNKGTRKIADLPQEKICTSSAHNPPTLMVYEPGVYEHTCPHCGNIQVFTVGNKPTF